MIEHWKSTKCRLCNSENMSKVIPLEAIPIGEKYLENPDKEADKRFPVDLYNCSDCYCVQTLDSINSDYLWSDYTYFSSQTDGIIKHQEEFALKILDQYQIEKNSIVFDIGSNDGTLLQAFKSRDCRVFGVDPADTVADIANSHGIETHVGLFSSNEMDSFPEKYRTNFASIITAFNVFAHSDDMQGMIDGVKRALLPDGIFFFEVQYLKDILDKKLIGTIFHEHMIHYSVNSAQNFLEDNDMLLIDAQRNGIQKGSIIFTAVKKGNILEEQDSVSILKKLENNDGYTDGSKFEEFNSSIRKNRDIVSTIVQEIEQKRGEIVGYGAARSGPTLAIQLGLENTLTSLYDDHPSKVDKFSAFESLKVFPTSELIIKMPSLTVILAWLHSKNIISKSVDYLQKGGKFLVLWPEVVIIDKNNYSEWIK